MASKQSKVPRYVEAGTVPKHAPVGRVLCHNSAPRMIDTASGTEGFRAWTEPKVPPNFVKCGCGWSGLPHYAHRASPITRCTKPGKIFSQPGMGCRFEAQDHDHHIHGRNINGENTMSKDEGVSFKDTGAPESWDCIDCGMDTAPGMFNRAELEKAATDLGDAWKNGAGIEQSIDAQSEVYIVRPKVWEQAGMTDMGGCLCIGCLEKRLGRRLRPKDFLRGNAFNAPHVPGTDRLRDRRGLAKDIAALMRQAKAG